MYIPGHEKTCLCYSKQQGCRDQPADMCQKDEQCHENTCFS